MKAGDTLMRKLGFLTIFLCYFLFAGCASATTYYISFSSGSNTNNGTSQSTPWKTHPYMQTGPGCTGSGSAPSYSHSAGDQFVFKQGDSWPNACFDMAIQDGGSPGNPDVYTFDSAWGTSSGTVGNKGQAVGAYRFDAGGSVISGSDGWNDFVYDNNHNDITFNGMELTGMKWTGSNSYGNQQMFQLQQSTNVIVSNVWAHNWTHPGAPSGADSLAVMVGNGAGPYSVGTRLTGSVIDGANSGGAGVADSGEAIFAIQICDNNIIKNVTNGCLVNVNGIVHDNIIGPVNQSFSSSNHENCVEPIDMQGSNGGSAGPSVVLVYNNVWHDCTAVGFLGQGAAPNGGWELDYLWNNVIYVGNVSSPPIPIQFSAVSGSNGNSQVHAWNNTIYAGSSDVCIRTLSQGGGNFGVVDIQNNHCISDQGLIALGLGGNTYTNTHNVLMSTGTAASQGYTSSERYAYSPAAATDGTVGAGVNLTAVALSSIATLLSDATFGGIKLASSRPLVGAWDAGAYQFSSSGNSGAPAPPTNVKVVVVQ